MSERALVLLTGATGVVGSALLPRLWRHDIVSLTHRARAGGRQVQGDLTKPMLGLDHSTYRRLAEQVDTVVHAAAVTSFDAGEQATDALNVAGTERMLQFAADAGARFLYVSTAFVARAELTLGARGGPTWDAAALPEVYLDSKRRAELLVTSSGLDTAIARPAVVIGDSGTGEISRFQGLHGLVVALLRNHLPVVPLDPGARVDILPADVVADALAALVDGGVPAGEYWLTPGPAAPTARTLVEQTIRVAAGIGVTAEAPRFVSPEMFDRLLRPVFLDALPPRSRRRFDDLLAMTALFSDAEPFPTSLGDIPGGPAALGESELGAAFAASVRYLAQTSRLIRPAGTEGAA